MDRQELYQRVLEARNWARSDDGLDPTDDARITFDKLVDAVALGRDPETVKAAAQELEYAVRNDKKLQGTPVEDAAEAALEFTEAV